jgi:hypothetical protein
MMRAIKLVLAVVVIAIAASLYGCASSDSEQTAAMKSTCQDQNDCEARDNARQIRDEADYQDEPSLGYLNSPPGLLPIPLTSRNTSSN